MPEKKELHLRYNWGQPNEYMITVFVDEKRLAKIMEIIELNNEVHLEEAYRRTT